MVNQPDDISGIFSGNELFTYRYIGNRPDIKKNRRVDMYDGTDRRSRILCVAIVVSVVGSSDDSVGFSIYK